MLTAIEWAMQLDYRHRPVDVSAFLNTLLEDAPESVVTSIEDARRQLQAKVA